LEVSLDGMVTRLNEAQSSGIILGAVVGATVGGPAGAVVGSVIGYLLGSGAQPPT
jgi:hypothetical protein